MTTFYRSGESGFGRAGTKTLPELLPKTSFTPLFSPPLHLITIISTIRVYIRINKYKIFAYACARVYARVYTCVRVCVCVCALLFIPLDIVGLHRCSIIKLTLPETGSRGNKQNFVVLVMVRD